MLRQCMKREKEAARKAGSMWGYLALLAEKEAKLMVRKKSFCWGYKRTIPMGSIMSLALGMTVCVIS